METKTLGCVCNGNAKWKVNPHDNRDHEMREGRCEEVGCDK